METTLKENTHQNHFHKQLINISKQINSQADELIIELKQLTEKVRTTKYKKQHFQFIENQTRLAKENTFRYQKYQQQELLHKSTFKQMELIRNEQQISKVKKKQKILIFKHDDQNYRNWNLEKQKTEDRNIADDTEIKKQVEYCHKSQSDTKWMYMSQQQIDEVKKQHKKQNKDYMLYMRCASNKASSQQRHQWRVK